MALGAPTAISDNEKVLNAKVQIVEISPESPAQEAGLIAGDTVLNIKSELESKDINKTKDVQEFTDLHKGEEIILTIQRGEEIFETSVVPRISQPNGEGAIGIGLIRTAIISYAWYKAPIQGILATGNLTLAILNGWFRVLSGGLSGAQVVGPVGILSLFNQMSKLGVVYFIQFIAIIAIQLGLFNLLPIPALDGGKVLFLAIEKFRGKAINPEIEQKITASFFFLLIILMIWITIKDIIRIF